MGKKHATVKPGYEVPVRLCECGSKMRPWTYLDVDEWGGQGWECLDCLDQADDEASELWPFVEDWANPADFKALGFEVEC